MHWACGGRPVAGIFASPSLRVSRRKKGSASSGARSNCRLHGFSVIGNAVPLCAVVEDVAGR